MKFNCDQCNAQYVIADEKVGPRGVKVKCKKCQNMIFVKPLLTGESTAVDAPGGVAAPTDDAGPAAEAEAPAPRRTEMELSGAFDALVSKDDRRATAPQPEGGKSGEREWYVAVGDGQVGPVDLGDVAARYNAGEINDDSLAWKAGMPDWLPVSDIPELSHLSRETASKRPTASPMTSTASSSAPVSSSKTAAPVEWKPSAASALSALLQEEVPAAKEEAPKSETLPDLAAGLGGGDLFSAPAAAPAPPVGDGGGVNWTVPTPRRSGMSPLAIAGIVGGIAVLGFMGVVSYKLLSTPTVVPVVAQAPVAAAPSPAAPAPAPAAPPTVAAPTPAPVAAAPAAASPAADEEERRSGGRHKAKGAHAGAARNEPSKAAGAAPAAAPAAAAPPAAAAKASLTRDDIWNGVKANASKVAPCLQAARGRNEFPPGSYTFTLDWTIRPDGGVSSPELKGPPPVMGTSLPKCFASVVANWRFPASQAGAPIKNFPFGPITVR